MAVNGKVVLSANYREVDCPSVGWKSPEPPGPRVNNCSVTAGDWIELKAGQVVDLDILIGERHGGEFAAMLMIEKRGETYERFEGHRVLPVFQLAPFHTPPAREPEKRPVDCPQRAHLESDPVAEAWQNGSGGSLAQNKAR